MKYFFTLLALLFILVCKAQPSITFSAPATTCITAHPVTLTANFAGFTPPLTVVWTLYSSNYFSPSGPITITRAGITNSYDTIQNYKGLGIRIMVTDAINQTAQNIYVFGPPINYFAYSTPGVCPGAPQATAMAYNITGGTPPYSFQWYDQMTNAVIGIGNPITLPAIPNLYGVKITDATGCYTSSAYRLDTNIKAYSYTIAQFAFHLHATAASCTNGTVSVGTITGTSVPPYTYLWSNGATSSSISNVSQGYYSLSVTDAQGCTASADTQVVQQPAIQVHTVVTPATCLLSNGAITAFASGGVSPYTYLYSNGSNTQTQTNIPSDSYSVTATDANGCTGVDNPYVFATTPITVNYNSTPSLCTASTGTATLSISGGTAPYTVTWSTYPAQTGTSLHSLPPGTYNFHVVDATGCTQDGTVVISPIHVMSAFFSVTNAQCTHANGSVTPFVSGGAAPYTYSWSNGATTAILSNAVAGPYSVGITDSAGCQISKYIEVGITSPVITNISSTPASCIFTTDGVINAAATGGTAPYTYHWNNGQTGPTINNLLTGPYYVSVTDAAGCPGSGYAYLGYNTAANNCYCTIQGHVYHDLNGNCLRDAGEPGIENIQMQCSGRGYTYTDSNGYYSFIVPTGTYTVSQTVKAFYPLQSCQSSAIVINANAASGCTHTVNFADSLDPIHDMHVSLWNNNFAIPGFAYQQRLIVKNEGTVAEPAIQNSYATDGQINGATFLPSGIFPTGPTNDYRVTTGFPTLQPGATQSFLINYNVPANIPLNTSLVFTDTVSNSAPLTSWPNDYSPWNNVRYFSTITIGSFDPNFKAVSPQGTGPTGLISYTDSTLEYMVHFQNTGTYYAQNVVVLDTLDTNLDWTSLSPEYTSAKCVVTLNNGIAKFSFNNILLPAQAADDERSNGMLSYTVKLKKNLPLGTRIKNRAAIFFDYNKPVMTNTTINTINKTSGINEITAQAYNSFNIYPNPTTGNFNIVINSQDGDAHAQLVITDIAGRRIFVQPFALQKGKQALPVKMGKLPSGVYIATMNAGGQVLTQKLVVIN